MSTFALNERARPLGGILMAAPGRSTLATWRPSGRALLPCYSRGPSAAWSTPFPEAPLPDGP